MKHTHTHGILQLAQDGTVLITTTVAMTFASAMSFLYISRSIVDYALAFGLAALFSIIILFSYYSDKQKFRQEEKSDGRTNSSKPRTAGTEKSA